MFVIDFPNSSRKSLDIPSNNLSSRSSSRSIKGQANEKFLELSFSAFSLDCLLENLLQPLNWVSFPSFRHPFNRLPNASGRPWIRSPLSLYLLFNVISSHPLPCLHSVPSKMCHPVVCQLLIASKFNLLRIRQVLIGNHQQIALFPFSVFYDDRQRRRR